MLQREQQEIRMDDILMCLFSLEYECCKLILSSDSVNEFEYFFIAAMSRVL
jgi:hypothetical protein